MGGRILIVEDDDECRDIMSDILRDEGYLVRGVPDGSSALAELGGGGYDLILLDLWMPQMDGGAFRDAQLRDPRMASVPVIVLSAGPREELAALGLPSIRKPVRLDALLSAVRRAIGEGREEHPHGP